MAHREALSAAAAVRLLDRKTSCTAGPQVSETQLLILSSHEDREGVGSV